MITLNIEKHVYRAHEVGLLAVKYSLHPNRSWEIALYSTTTSVAVDCEPPLHAIYFPTLTETADMYTLTSLPQPRERSLRS